jgi:hypothetical protein
MIDYARAQREFPRLKGALTRAINAGDWHGVVTACEKAFDAFDEWGAWPDDWHRWENALMDIALNPALDPDLTAEAAWLMGRCR